MNEIIAYNVLQAKFNQIKINLDIAYLLLILEISNPI